MKFKLMLLALLVIAACQNTNPERGSGGNRVEKQTVLGSAAILDSAKSILDQSYSLRAQLQKGKISQAAFEEKNAGLMLHFKSVHASLSSSDTLVIEQYKKEKEQALAEESKKNNSSGIWE